MLREIEFLAPECAGAYGGIARVGREARMTQCTPSRRVGRTSTLVVSWPKPPKTPRGRPCCVKEDYHIPRSLLLARGVEKRLRDASDGRASRACTLLTYGPSR